MFLLQICDFTHTNYCNFNCFQDLIQKPMLRTSDRIVKKEAIEVFKHIL